MEDLGVGSVEEIGDISFHWELEESARCVGYDEGHGAKILFEVSHEARATVVAYPPMAARSASVQMVFVDRIVLSVSVG